MSPGNNNNEKDAMSLNPRLNDSKERVQAGEAAQMLQRELGEREAYWRVFLQNNRRADRKPSTVIPYQVQRGRPTYAQADLEAFVSKSRADAMSRGLVSTKLDDALRAIGGWPTGRPWTAYITPQVEEGTGVTFVRVHLADPLAVYRLDPDQARQVAAELIEAANAVDRAAGSRA